MYARVLFAMLTISTFATAAVYQGTGKYEGREIEIYADLNIPNYLTSEATTVKATKEFEDHYHSDMITYYCTTSVEFLGPTLTLRVTDVKTGELLNFVDEEEASLVANHYQRSYEKFPCNEVDFSKTAVALTFTVKDVKYHLPIAKKEGYDVSLALYPLLSARAEMTLEKQGDRYLIFKAEEFESKLEKELSIPILHWGGLTKNLGSIELKIN